MNGLRILFTSCPTHQLEGAHPWFVRVGSCALTPPILFFSLLGLPFSGVTLFRNLKLKTYNLQLSAPRRLFA
jgi:hypothetical protein